MKNKRHIKETTNTFILLEGLIHYENIWLFFILLAFFIGDMINQLIVAALVPSTHF